MIDQEDIRIDQQAEELDQIIHEDIDVRIMETEEFDQAIKDSRCLFMEILPLEIRQEIFSYVVCVDQSVHLYSFWDGCAELFRLSLCKDSSFDFSNGHCNCPSRSRYNANVSPKPKYFHNALFMVSKTTRRETLDTFFATNQITFTADSDLENFVNRFTRTSSKIRNLRLFFRVDDEDKYSWQIEHWKKLRTLLPMLKHLDLQIYIAPSDKYQTIYEDALVQELTAFAMGSISAQPPMRQIKVENQTAQSSFGPKKRTANEMLLGTSTASFIAKSLSYFFAPNAMPQSLQSQQVPPAQISTLQTCKITVQPSYIARLLANSDKNRAVSVGTLERVRTRLLDVFINKDQKYQRISDIPPMMPRPDLKPKPKPKPAPFTDKRGTLFLEY